MPTSSTDPGHASPTVAIIGAGRLGTALARALRAADVDVIGPLGRDLDGTAPDGDRAGIAEFSEGAIADVALLCVPDAEIAPAAAAVRGRAALVGHTSGATPLGALEPAQAGAFGLHPLQTFAGGEAPDAFDGAGCAVGGTTPAALAAARGLAERLGMRAVEICDGDRAAYHAAASMASNFLVTLQAAAEDVAAGAGLEPAHARALLVPLVRSTVENWAARGPDDALTGPVARGDDATVERQRRAVEASAPHLLALFDELVARTRALAGARDAADGPAAPGDASADADDADPAATPAVAA